MRKGFTLVELSIVLVIVGLLTGGVLVAQSMVSAARLTGFIAQIQQYDAGVENFKTKYNALPGDSAAFGGDGNGFITMGATVGWVTQTNSYAGEIANFWNEIMPDQYAATPWSDPGVLPQISGPNKNVPGSKIGPPGTYFYASATGTTNYGSTDLTDKRNFYSILTAGSIPAATHLGWWQPLPTNVAGWPMKPVDNLAVDKKIDNGDPATGSVLAGDYGDGGLGTDGGIRPIPTANCVTGGNYNVGYNNYACTPMIQIGGMAGDPQ